MDSEVFLGDQLLTENSPKIHGKNSLKIELGTKICEVKAIL
jgi:hypothetical protein